MESKVQPTALRSTVPILWYSPPVPPGATANTHAPQFQQASPPQYEYEWMEKYVHSGGDVLKEEFRCNRSLIPLGEVERLYQYHEQAKTHVENHPGSPRDLKALYIQPVLDIFCGIRNPHVPGTLITSDDVDASLVIAPLTCAYTIYDRTTSEEAAILLVAFMEPGTLEPYSRKDALASGVGSIGGVHQAVSLASQFQAPRVILTDELSAVFLLVREDEPVLADTNIVVETDDLLAPIKSVPLRASISIMLRRYYFTKGDWYLFNAPHSFELPPPPAEEWRENPRTLEDFDVNKIMAGKQHINPYIQWRKRAEAGAEFLTSGRTIKGKTGPFPDPLRSDYPSQALSAAELDLLKRFPRPIEGDVCSLLAGPPKDFKLVLGGPIRQETDRWSQIFHVKKLSIPKTRFVVPKNLCLKLYDERYFPKQWFDGQKHISWLKWRTARDLVRREEAAYFRLHDLQGTLLPHSYGFYEFTLPDGHVLPGFLMEYINSECTLSGLRMQNWDEECQDDMWKLMRTAARALRYAGVVPNWWFERHVLLPSAENEDEGDESGDESEGVNSQPPVVLVDFAHSELQPCQCHIFVTMTDWYRFEQVMSDAGIDRDLDLDDFEV